MIAWVHSENVLWHFGVCMKRGNGGVTPQLLFQILTKVWWAVTQHITGGELKYPLWMVFYCIRISSMWCLLWLTTVCLLALAVCLGWYCVSERQLQLLLSEGCFDWMDPHRMIDQGMVSIFRNTTQFKLLRPVYSTKNALCYLCYLQSYYAHRWGQWWLYLC